MKGINILKCILDGVLENKYIDNLVFCRCFKKEYFDIFVFLVFWKRFVGSNIIFVILFLVYFSYTFFWSGIYLVGDWDYFVVWRRIGKFDLSFKLKNKKG